MPAKSTLTLRGSGFRGTALALEILETGAKEPVRIGPDQPAGNVRKIRRQIRRNAVGKAGKLDVVEVRYDLKTSARVRALAGSEELGSWTFDVTPDTLPKITLKKDFSHTAQGFAQAQLLGRGRLRHLRCRGEGAPAEDRGWRSRQGLGPRRAPQGTAPAA